MANPYIDSLTGYSDDQLNKLYPTRPDIIAQIQASRVPATNMSIDPSLVAPPAQSVDPSTMATPSPQPTPSVTPSPTPAPQQDLQPQTSLNDSDFDSQSPAGSPAPGLQPAPALPAGQNAAFSNAQPPPTAQSDLQNQIDKLNQGKLSNLDDEKAQNTNIGALDTQRAKLYDSVNAVANQKMQKWITTRDSEIANNQKTALANLQTSLSAVDDLAKNKINPEQFWGDRTTGQKVVAAFALALGGIGQGLMHTGSNAALDVLNTQIKNNIDAQEKNYEMKKGQVSMKDNLFAQQMNIYKDTQSAKDALQMIYLNQAQRYGQSLLATNPGTIAPKVQILNDQISNQQNDLQQAFIAKKAMMMTAKDNPTVALQLKYANNPALMKMAEKQLEDKNKWDSMSAHTMDAYDSVGNIGVTGYIPSWMPYGKSSEYGSSIADAVSQLIEESKRSGRSIPLLQETIKNKFPKPSDPASTVSTNRPKLLNYLNANSPPTDLLDSAGIKFPTVGAGIPQNIAPPPVKAK